MIPASSHDRSVTSDFSYTSAGPAALGGRWGRSTLTMLLGCFAWRADFCASFSTSNGGAMTADRSGKRVLL